VYWLFLVASGLAVIVLRFKQPNVERPFRVPLYPLLPRGFVGVSVAMCWSSIGYVATLNDRGPAVMMGLIVVGVGVVLMAWKPAAKSV
jgi:amino acid transporter